MINNVRLVNFRSWRDASFEFGPGVNIIVGPNASGKTNLLEAVIALSRGSSFRAKDQDLIQFDKPWLRLEGDFDNQTRVLKIQDGEAGQKSLGINGKTLVRLKLEHTHPVVYFEPNHLTLLTRSPADRRGYIDELLGLTHPAFRSLERAYKRTLAQRNNLLKKGSASTGEQMFAWDVRLSQLGAQIASARLELINKINLKLPAVYSKIARKKSAAAISYKILAPIDVYATKMVAKLKKELSIDIERGFSGSGPHREDIVFIINGRPIGPTASRGEIRSLLLALKIIELDLVSEARDAPAIFLLDDVFSELDGGRRQALVKAIKSHQSILTTTDADAVLDYFATKDYRLIALKRR